MDSLLVKNIGFLSLEQIKKLAYERNQELCLPPLDDRDMERLWNQALDWANRKIREREEAAAKQQQQNQHEQEEGQKNNNTARTTTKTKIEKQDLIEEATRLVMSIHRFLTI
jgi:hypothetical protein